MELSQLEVFLAVAREHRFSRAAEKLYRTQSAVSQTIRKLETELGESLFDRSSREGILTDAGQVLYEYAERLLNLRQDARESLTELRELHKGKLLIAANEFTALYLLPVLAEFRRLHPMIKITVQRALGSRIPDDVLQHSAELGVLSYKPEEPRLHSVVTYLDELVLVVPPKHPLATAREVSIRQLGAESFVAHIVSSPYREKVLQTFQKYKTPLHMGLELPTLQAIKQFVAMGNAVVSESVVRSMAAVMAARRSSTRVRTGCGTAAAYGDICTAPSFNPHQRLCGFQVPASRSRASCT